jgi:hypothetical protein
MHLALILGGTFHLIAAMLHFCRTSMWTQGCKPLSPT